MGCKMAGQRMVRLQRCSCCSTCATLFGVSVCGIPWDTVWRELSASAVSTPLAPLSPLMPAVSNPYYVLADTQKDSSKENVKRHGGHVAGSHLPCQPAPGQPNDCILLLPSTSDGLPGLRKTPQHLGPGLPGKMPGNTQTVIKRLNPYVDVTLGQMRLCHLPRQ